MMPAPFSVQQARDALARWVIDKVLCMCDIVTCRLDRDMAAVERSQRAVRVEAPLLGDIQRFRTDVVRTQDVLKEHANWCECTFAIRHPPPHRLSRFKHEMQISLPTVPPPRPYAASTVSTALPVAAPVYRFDTGTRTCAEASPHTRPPAAPAYHPPPLPSLHFGMDEHGALQVFKS